MNLFHCVGLLIVWTCCALISLVALNQPRVADDPTVTLVVFFSLLAATFVTTMILYKREPR